jgi:hypothetical protein
MSVFIVIVHIFVRILDLVRVVRHSKSNEIL